MKNLKSILIVIITFVSSAVFANNDPVVNQKFETAFKKHFPATTVQSWENDGNLTIAYFWENKTKYKAYFDTDANLLATGRYLTADLLPLTVGRELSKKFGSFGNVGVLEVSKTDADTFYYLKVPYKDKLQTIRVYPSGAYEIIGEEKYN